MLANAIDWRGKVTPSWHGMLHGQQISSHMFGNHSYMQWQQHLLQRRKSMSFSLSISHDLADSKQQDSAEQCTIIGPLVSQQLNEEKSTSEICQHQVNFCQVSGRIFCRGILNSNLYCV